MLAKYNHDRNIDITYAGYPILDPDYTDNECTATKISNKDIAKLLYHNKQILGYIHGNSECGPRALGHRSIICYPDVENLKDILNSKVKFREWYRPFGAITKLENIHKYFTNACESPYMNFCPTLREQYRLPSITHIDNTCRIQTITQQQHPEIYDILTHIENMGGIGILLNTSFNIKGKPILTTRKDAFDIIKTTKLDGFVHNNILHTHQPKTTDPLKKLTIFNI
jgi:carbamoyltransferase